MAKSNPNCYVGILKRRVTWILIPAILLAILPAFFVDKTQDGRARSLSQGPVNASRVRPTPNAGSPSVEPWKSHVAGFALGSAIGIVLALVIKPKEASRKEGLPVAELAGVRVLASIPTIQGKRKTGQDTSKARSKL